MITCQTCQSQLLHHLYGVLDDAETQALVTHLGECPECQSALDKARGQQGLLAAAARAEFPNVRFDPVTVTAQPQTTRVASPPRRFAPRRWAIAASILVLVGGPMVYMASTWIGERNGFQGGEAKQYAAMEGREESGKTVNLGNGLKFESRATEPENASTKKLNLKPYYSNPMSPGWGPDAMHSKDARGEDKSSMPPGALATPKAPSGVPPGFATGVTTGSAKDKGAFGIPPLSGAGGGFRGFPGGGVDGMPAGTAVPPPSGFPLPPGTTKGPAKGDSAKKGTVVLPDLGGIVIKVLDPKAVDAAAKEIGKLKDKDVGTDKVKGDKGDVTTDDEAKRLETAKAAAEKEKLAAAARENNIIGAGQLTAGSFDDSAHPSSFKRFLQTLAQNTQVGGIPAQMRGRQVVITVKDSAGKPVDNARVEVSAGNAKVQLLSRTDGRVVVVTPWDGLPEDAHWAVNVTPAEAGSKTVTSECTPRMDKLDVVLPESRNLPTRVLDLALVVDCTGSMTDELEYIKAELKWIATSISEKYPDVKQRYALIAYRDQGDEYVTRTFQFTDSIDLLLANLRAQHAGGGGDMPEAVQKAMDEAMQLQWSAGHASRVLIHVADAPPHGQDFEYSMKAVDKIRKTGIAFYPVACSGYDPACELHMRASALLTGGKFLFLTDDSGIGNSHAEPHIHDYPVERLAPLMLRMISSEIAGQQIAVNPQDIIRTVGNPPAPVKK